MRSSLILSFMLAVVLTIPLVCEGRDTGNLPEKPQAPAALKDVSIQTGDLRHFSNAEKCVTGSPQSLF